MPLLRRLARRFGRVNRMDLHDLVGREMTDKVLGYENRTACLERVMNEVEFLSLQIDQGQEHECPELSRRAIARAVGLLLDLDSQYYREFGPDNMPGEENLGPKR
jgi:hypothetical protein